MKYVAILAAVLALAAARAGADVKIDQQANHLAVSVDGKAFTDYWFGPRDDRAYVRPFFVPVKARDGTNVTSDQYGQQEHPHHQSLWVGQGDVNGADHWSLEGKNPPKQRHLRFESVRGDTAIEDLEWEDKNHEPMLKERRTMRFRVWPDGSRGIEFTLEFTPMHDEVTFGDTKEAGLVSVRVAKAISDHPTLTNSTGATGEKATWGKAADWCDISGKIEGKPSGVCAMDHPSNPRHPTRWHVREYGLMGANPFGLSYFDHAPKHTGDFKMEPGKTVTFRYLVVVHEGDAKAAGLAEKYREFSSERAAALRAGRE